MVKYEDAHLREISISAKLEGSGISLSAKSRAVTALDRLIGSLFDMPATFFEGVSSKKRLQDKINEQLKIAQMRVAQKQIHDTPDLGVMLINDVLKDRAQKKANAAVVALETIDTIKALPPLQETTEDASAGNPEVKIDDDWMNQFTRYAEDASSEQLQQIWGRVLAGEIRKPKSFSRHTLRFISELDKETAESCELIAQYVIKDWFLSNKKWHNGKLMLAILELRQLGIIEGGAVGGLQKNFTIHADGFGGIAGKTWGLLVQATPKTELSVPIYLLTRMGQQIMSLLKVADEAASLREVAENLNKSGLQSISLGRGAIEHNDQFKFIGALEQLWVSPEERGAQYKKSLNVIKPTFLY